MRRVLPVVLLMVVLGCPGTDEVVAPPAAPTPTVAPTYEIHGTVTYNGSPMTATVIAAGGGRELARVTSSRFLGGFYRITGLPAGEIHLTAQSGYCGFFPLTVTVPVDGPVDLHLLQC